MMRYIFESKEKKPIDVHTSTEQAIAKEQLKLMMLCFETMINTMYPNLRVHLETENK